MKKILFVCMGNICRSPLAEGIVRARAASAGLSLQLDSAGTSAHHGGEAPDPRARAVARRHGTPIDDLRARQVVAADFRDFDLLLAADRQNLAHLSRLRPPGASAELALLLDWAGSEPGGEVPDPYYGDEEGFEAVYRLLDLAATGVLGRLSTAAGRREQA